MKGIGSAHPLEGVETPPDTVVNFALAAATAQAADWPSGTQVLRVSGISSANSALCFYINPRTTAAALPVNGTTATTATTLQQLAIIGERYMQVPASSTGFSLYASSSGYAVIECWKVSA
jgi:hypothetical protein